MAQTRLPDTPFNPFLGIWEILHQFKAVWISFDRVSISQPKLNLEPNLPHGSAIWGPKNQQARSYGSLKLSGRVDVLH